MIRVVEHREQRPGNRAAILRSEIFLLGSHSRSDHHGNFAAMS
jgi:hypothetical protein